MEALLALIILAADIWAIVQILQSGHTNGSKLFWVLIIVCLPVIGLIAWLVAGRRNAPAV
ncbi:MAG: PLD nuclease N-terminal domain-containing protein [Pseudolabrys sp.]|nr:PLD nuclease N-terminal domain-containing protein [Pseudolabrys sp.]MDP2298211.1 PLD nuclease N-terminal domain-containing protein [Pseudolabrys sp.]